MKYSFYLLLWTCLSLNAQIDSINADHRLDSIWVKSPRINPVSPAVLSANMTDFITERLPTTTLKNYGFGQLTTLSVRGLTAAQTPILWNEIPIQSPSLGQIDLSQLPLVLFSRMSLQTKPTDLGANSGIGGCFQLNTATDFSNDRLTKIIGTSVSNIQRYQLYGILPFQYKKWIATTRFFALNAPNRYPYKRFDTAATEKMTHSNESQYHILQSLGYKLNAKISLEATIWAQQTARLLPPTLSAYQSQSSQTDRDLRASFQLKQTFSNLLSQQISLGFLANALHFKDDLILLDAKSRFNRFFIKESLFYTQKNVSLSFFGEFSQNTATTDTYQNKQQTAFGGTLSAKYHLPKQHNIGIEIKQEGQIGRALPPQIALNSDVFLLKKFNLRLINSIGNRNRLPTMNDLFWNPGGNPNLQLEHSLFATADVEMNRQLNEIFWTQFSLHTIYQTVDNLIQWQPTTATYWAVTNIDKMTTQSISTNWGIEIQRKKEIAWLISLKTAFTKARYKVTITDNRYQKQLVYTPLWEHKANATYFIPLKNKHKIALHTNWQYFSTRFTTADNSYFLPPYLIGNAKISFLYASKRTWEIAIACDNLTNIHYQTLANRAMPLRHFFCSAEFRF